eukprot:2679703-Rhodomonas_salina.1
MVAPLLPLAMVEAVAASPTPVAAAVLTVTPTEAATVAEMDAAIDIPSAAATMDVNDVAIASAMSMVTGLSSESCAAGASGKWQRKMSTAVRLNQNKATKTANMHGSRRVE